ncbi:MAG: hypothetical protein CVV51_08705 [Spirochaetae bacterium HGW-Spirochaetae-7]|nr:MAG: hypothetical protein CVV51_08705 [Spirochaetae bacterium HGW-Spirochaetae-7]
MKRIDPCKIFKSELPGILKPARYLGGENGSTVKVEADLRVALCFPDLYEIGMANNAMRILYSRLNALEGVACERVFSVALDYESLLRTSGTPLYTLETGTPVADFDVLAFTIGYELAATNILAILDISAIPLYKAERGNNHPIVIAGGPAITNPAPYAKIFDAVWIGEAEDSFFELAAKLRVMKLAGSGKSELVAAMCAEPAMWIPGKRTVRSIYDDFSTAAYRHAFPTPVVKPIQDHGVVEIMRGCPNGCRFCHAGYFYRPRRLRSVDRILEDVETQVRVAGHREISLSSLSSGDYPGIAGLVSYLDRKWAAEGVSFQLPSLKVESFPLELIEDISGTRKSGLTFAVETPLEQWQMTLNKRVGLEKIQSILLEAEKRGYRVAKFYFMIGLPLPSAELSEEDAIIAFIREISAIAQAIRVNVTIATFVPKPHTPFQWSAQLSPADAAAKVYKIKDSFRNDKRVKVSYHAPFLSWLEGIVARGDERVGDLLVAAYRSGARFDAWDDLFNKSAWDKALASGEFGADACIAERATDERLPWSDVSLRVSRGFLLKERDRALQSILTEGCVDPCGVPCGSCSDDSTLSDGANIIERIKKLEAEMPDKAGGLEGLPSGIVARQAPLSGTRHRLLFNYSKNGRAAFFAHHEVHSMLCSAFERAGLPVAFSQGFNPMPRLEISEPLSLGFESADDYGAAILTGMPSSPLDSCIATANAHLHVEMQVLSFEFLECTAGIKFPSLSSVHWGSRFAIDVLDSGIIPADLASRLVVATNGIPQLAGSAIDCGATTVELLLPFTGKREYGLSALFEKASGIPIREARIAVRRVEQFAKAADGSRQRYFDCYRQFVVNKD